MRVILIEHFIHERLGNIGQSPAAATRLTTISPIPAASRPMRGRTSALILRPELLQAGLFLGQISRYGARAASVRRAFGTRAHVHSTMPHARHALNLPIAAREKEGTHAPEKHR